MITNEIRMALFRKASENTYDLYSSMKTAHLLGNIRKKFNITNDYFIDLIGDIILGIYPKGDFVRLMLENKVCLTKETVEKIENDLKELFDQIDSVSVNVEKTQPQKQLSINRDQIPSTPINKENGAPLTREAVMNALAPHTEENNR